MTSSSTNSGVSTITVTFDVDRDQDLAAVDVQNRVNQRARPAADRRAEHRRHRDEGLDGLHLARRLLLGAQPVRLAVPQQLRRRLHPGRAEARAGRRRRASSSASASSRCGCGSIPTRLASRGITARDVTRRAARAERAGRGRRRRPAARRAAASCIRSACAPPAGSASRREFDNIIVKAGKDGALVRAEGRRPRRARRRDLLEQPALRRLRRRRVRRHPAADGQRARHVRPACIAAARPAADDRSRRG